MAKKPTGLSEVDLDVADVRRVATTTDPQGETIISLDMPGGQIINVVFGPVTLAKLEALLAEASEAPRPKPQLSNRGSEHVRALFAGLFVG